MNRRKFFKWLGVGVSAIVVAPKALIPNPTSQPGINPGPFHIIIDTSWFQSGDILDGMGARWIVDKDKDETILRNVTSEDNKFQTLIVGKGEYQDFIHREALRQKGSKCVYSYDDVPVRIKVVDERIFQRPLLPNETFIKARRVGFSENYSNMLIRDILKNKV